MKNEKKKKKESKEKTKKKYQGNTQHVCDHPSAHPKQINRQFVVTPHIDWLHSLFFPYLTSCLCWI